MSMILILFIKNYYYVKEYTDRYLLKDTGFKSIDEKSKCFQYYNQPIYNKKNDENCLRYSHQYVVFVLDRAEYIQNYFKFNAVLICIICIIFIYQNLFHNIF